MNEVVTGSVSLWGPLALAGGIAFWAKWRNRSVGLENAALKTKVGLLLDRVKRLEDLTVAQALKLRELGG